MNEEVNIAEYIFIDQEDIVDIDFESISFIDFLKMANNTWKDGAPFDIDMGIINDAMKSVPVKVLQRRSLKVEDQEMYEVWAGVKINGSEYLVPVRFHAHISEYNQKVFTWKVSSPSQTVDLGSVITALEEHESAQWDDLLQ